MSSANSESLLVLFQSGFLLFLFLLWLLWPKLPKPCWIVVGRVGTLALLLTLREMFQFFTIEANVCYEFVIYGFYYVAMSLSYMAFIMLRYVPSMPIFWRIFIINQCWILSKAFSASIEIIMFFNLKTTHIYSFTILEFWSLKSVSLGQN